MQLHRRLARAVPVTFAALLAACAADAPDALAPTRIARDAGIVPGRGAVYTASNRATGNAVLVFERRADGSLADAVAYPTGGAGTSAGLGNQGGIVLARDGQRLAVVNAGSDEVSVFRVGPAGLALAATVPSGGDLPVSVALDGDLLYVANEGSASIAGFRLDAEGVPSPIAGSTQALSAGVDVGQIAFGPDGATIVVTEKNTNRVQVFPLGADGVAGPATTYDAAGRTPFGFGFGHRGTLVVSEATGGAPNGSAVSSYVLGGDASLATVTASAPTTQTAACWIVVTKDGRHAFTTNAGSATITAFGIGTDGMLSRLPLDGVSARTAAGPSDMALAGGDRFLYAISSGAGTISAFRVGVDGSLTPIGRTTLPAGANGLTAN
jgi:6-phosphogluconolactonase